MTQQQKNNEQAIFAQIAKKWGGREISFAVTTVESGSAQACTRPVSTPKSEAQTICAPKG